MNHARPRDDALLDRLRAGTGRTSRQIPVFRWSERLCEPPLSRHPAVERRHLAAISVAVRELDNADGLLPEDADDSRVAPRPPVGWPPGGPCEPLRPRTRRFDEGYAGVWTPAPVRQARAGPPVPASADRTATAGPDGASRVLAAARGTGRSAATAPAARPRDMRARARRPAAAARFRAGEDTLRSAAGAAVRAAGPAWFATRQKLLRPSQARSLARPGPARRSPANAGLRSRAERAKEAAS